MDLKEAKKNIASRYKGCTIVSAKDFRSGFLFRIVPDEYASKPEEVASDSIFMSKDGSIATYNPLNISERTTQ